LLTVLGGYLQEAGRLDQSRELLDTIVRSYPDYLEAKILSRSLMRA
jgi:hypothetical protein